MKRAGLSAMEVLVSATRNGAAVCGVTDRGTLEAGKVADFVVLNEDPLQDIRNTREIWQVWHNGQPAKLREANK